MEAIKPRRLKYAGWLLLGVIVTLVAVKAIVAPYAIRHWLVSGLRQDCETCELKLGRVYLSIFPPVLNVAPAKLTWGIPNVTVVDAEADRISVPFSVRELFSRRFCLGHIEIERPNVKVIEGDRNSPVSKSQGGSGGVKLEIEGVHLRQGSFSYVREHLKQRGELRVAQIAVTIGPIGSSNRVSHKLVEGKAMGVLEDSGSFALSVAADIFAAAPRVNVELELKSQNLADLNRFFMPNDGVHLQGKLIEGRSSVSVRGHSLTASDYVRYRDLNIKINENKERSAFSAFFQNLLVSIKMGKQNVAADQIHLTGTVNLEREPHQTLISFILSGMKEAAFKVASKGGS